MLNDQKFHEIFGFSAQLINPDRRIQDVPESILKAERRKPVNIINQEILDTLCKICFVAGECNCEQQEDNENE